MRIKCASAACEDTQLPAAGILAQKEGRERDAGDVGRSTSVRTTNLSLFLSENSQAADRQSRWDLLVVMWSSTLTGDTESSTIMSDLTDKSLTGPNGL